MSLNEHCIEERLMDSEYRLSGILELPARPIVIVEDDPNDQKLMLRAFRKNQVQNPQVLLRDGEEALEYFQFRGPWADRDPLVQPVLVLLDLKLPRVSGLQVLEELRKDERTQRLPIVVLTSSDEHSDKLRSYGLGANSFVRKPIDYQEFTDIVAQLCRYWTTVNEPPE